MSNTTMSRAAALPVHRSSYDQTGSFTISRELVADRLRCMLEHIHTGHAEQVLLHSISIAGALTPVSSSAGATRDLVQEALGMFLRGNANLAEQRLQDALSSASFFRVERKERQGRRDLDSTSSSTVLNRFR